MPPTSGEGDLSSDDYVAQVLAREARDNSLKYSAQGLEAYMPKRPTSGAPKPNMRFLRNIIRDTDNHNASLKRKEDREARERMRSLQDNNNGSGSTSSRDQRRHRRGEGEEKHRSHRRRHRSRSTSPERDRSRRHRHRRDGYESDEDRRRRHSRRERRSDGHERRWNRSYSRSRSRSPRLDTRSPHDPDRLSPYRSLSPEPRRGHKYKDGDRRNGHRSRHHHSSRRSTRPKEPSPLAEPSEHDSDPLEDLVGPLPRRDEEDRSSKTIHSRGRGAYKPNLSNIDAHFAPDYDPTLDVNMEDNEQASTRPTRRPVPGLMTDDDDWELALEALRDRARWRQKGEDRLREAGFNDSVVERWKNNAAFTGGEQGEGSVEDVRWSKKGEGREWDRGKYVDDEGSVDVRAGW